MPHVTLIGPLKVAAGGVSEVHVDARNVRALLKALGERYPGLAPLLDEGVAIAIDGQIFQDALLEPIPPDAEVQILPPLAGG